MYESNCVYTTYTSARHMSGSNTSGCVRKYKEMLVNLPAHACSAHDVKRHQFISCCNTRH
eukprot:14459-Heterococcus_DN1.PRE.4